MGAPSTSPTLTVGPATSGARTPAFLFPGRGWRARPALGLAFAWLGILACGDKGTVSTERPGTTALAGERVNPPRRIVSLAPNLTEMVYALGAQDRLVGVTQYCKFPPEAREKPKVGALVNMNYERLLALGPDLVLLLPGHAQVERELKRMGLPTLTVRTESIEDILAALLTVGRALGLESRAQERVDELKGRLAAVEARVRPPTPADASSAAPPRVLFVIGRNPGTLQQIYACGQASYLGQLLEAAGAVNAVGSTASPWPVINKETLLKLDPDVILDGSLYGGEEAAVDSAVHMAAWDQMGTLSAVRAGRVIPVANERLLIPGPGVADGVEELRRLIAGVRAGEASPSAATPP